MNRPGGIVVIAILFFIGACGLLLLAVGAFVGGGLAGAMLSQKSGVPAALIASLGAVLGIFFLLLCVLYVAVGVGLLQLKEWARIIAIVLACIGLLVGVLSLLHFNLFAIVRVAITGFILWYLLQPEVVSAFRSAKPGMPPIPAG